MNYKNFELALYCRVWDLNAISDLNAFAESFKLMEKHLKINKVYLETLRNFETISREKMMEIKEFFSSRGMKTSGGITVTAAEDFNGVGFKSLCYMHETDRGKLKETVEFTASLFDEIILDDFYFTNCKCEYCMKAKGDRSWAEFRTVLMKEVSEELVLKPARQVNPKVNVIIKFPNWYEHYQETGYNLADEPGMFDMVYTGTETRDPLHAQQHLPRYLSYFIMRYIENVKPGKNGGGWFDPYECSYNLGSYVEQANLTLFGKAREVTLFCLASLLEEDGAVFIPLAGHVFDSMDRHLDKLGTPTGTACYIPYHSCGEDYLHNYIGMLGIPLEPFPQYPKEHNNIFLTENAAKDRDIIAKIQQSLLKGANVVITSGLVKALKDKGFEDLAKIRYSERKAAVKSFAISKNGINFSGFTYAEKAMMIPQLEYSTNDAWQMAAAMGGDNSFPILLQVSYGKGNLFILTIPDDFGDLYNYPKEVLKAVRKAFAPDTPVKLDCRSKVGLFTYDNDTFILESFLSHDEEIALEIDSEGAKLFNLVTGDEIQGHTRMNKTEFKFSIPPTSYRILKIEK